jgi:hypothetical protein
MSIIICGELLNTPTKSTTNLYRWYDMITNDDIEYLTTKLFKLIKKYDKIEDISIELTDGNYSHPTYYVGYRIRKDYEIIKTMTFNTNKRIFEIIEEKAFKWDEKEQKIYFKKEVKKALKEVYLKMNDIYIEALQNKVKAM